MISPTNGLGPNLDYTILITQASEVNTALDGGCIRKRPTSPTSAVSVVEAMTNSKLASLHHSTNCRVQSSLTTLSVLAKPKHPIKLRHIVHIRAIP
ncbi:hypothetical protein DSO57_1028969 [Entomophthora muscae]|uniref:Uncharacterized protein n=1 Tax=Entomophthora muscae TaxID=34485 RepID=A0ACC2TN40_9FUNG|nr:hypothetical protein DSO57_1028969 [Entomophthora muscae]